MRKAHGGRVCAVLLFVAMATAGCGGGDTSASGGASTSASASSQAVSSAPAGSTSAICADVAALKATITRLDRTKLGQGDLTALAQQLSQVASDLTKLKNESAGPYAADVHAVDQAAGAVASSLTAATSSPSAKTVRAVGTSLRALGASVSALGDAVKSTC